ncbi:hypothetical protein BH09SUM1_BH09SUM1_19100 [soil metagenome]
MDDSGGLTDLEMQEVLERRSTLRLMLLLFIASIFAMAIEIRTPIRFGPNYDMYFSGLTPFMSIEFVRAALLPSFLLPPFLYLSLGNRQVVRLVTYLCYGGILYVETAYIYVKSTTVLLSAFPELDRPDILPAWKSTLMRNADLSVVFNIAVALALIACFIPGTIILISGLAAVPALAGKDYRFGIYERGTLLLRVGRRGLRRMPPRQEFAMAPGYGRGTVAEIAELIKGLNQE